MLYPAQPFFSGATRTLKAGQLGMDVPIAVSIAAIYVASVLETVRGGADVYFDSVSMFVLFLLTARYVEMRARHRAGELTDALARLTPAIAERRRGDGSLESVGTHELQRGDRIHVAEGGAIPADGVLEGLRCQVDESPLSGESAPVTRRRGECVIAGSIVVDGPVDVRVERVGAQTALAGIAALAERALTERPRLVSASELVARPFVTAVLLLTCATVVGWCLVDASRAFAAALAVMVAACPCAFALAAPAAFTRALAVLARHGVLVVRPDALEALASATHVVFDKTGTLTEPELRLADISVRDRAGRDEALRQLALARESRHPVARAIAVGGDATLFTACEKGSVPSVTNFQVTNGLGIVGRVEGRDLRLGRADFANRGEAVAERDRDAVLLCDDFGELAAFHLGERLRPGAARAVAMLRDQGLVIQISSGDAASKVEAVAKLVAIDTWHARQLPSDKLAALDALRQQGARVIAVGDGINDAPVLAGADVGIALAGSAELTQARSDIVLPGDRLDAIAPARSLARQTPAILGRTTAGHSRQPRRDSAGRARLRTAVARRARDVVELARGRGELAAHRLEISVRDRSSRRPRGRAATGGDQVNALVLLIPLSLLLLAVAVWAFFWAVDNDQFDDLDTPALLPLDDVTDVPPERER